MLMLCVLSEMLLLLLQRRYLSLQQDGGVIHFRKNQEAINASTEALQGQAHHCLRGCRPLEVSPVDVTEQY
eukprot:CAMPEP_0171108448 /NCGR_PEP_ID=MMETSP0766_2-20121228/68976_1 /TAXON_ID=439317 /ORGANISM="Gambierdiscus australes, Strain CAWD 149" /LENGTH=70 /DNA_ID=CAMNT_0011569985 /DNA_START=364 /DNA_END=576 /DNA_ORIENTATION=-